MQEFNALLELLAMLVMDPRTGVLIALLVAGAISDCRSYRIPNWLSFGGAAFALIYNTLVPFPFHAGFWWAFGGLCAGLLLMLPMYLLRVMGAGDAKLMAMAGAFLGLTDALHAALYVFIAGGVLALGYGLTHRVLGRLASNIRNLSRNLMLSALAGIRPQAGAEAIESVGKLPYGVSIAVGTVTYVVLRQLGYA